MRRDLLPNKGSMGWKDRRKDYGAETPFKFQRTNVLDYYPLHYKVVRNNLPPKVFTEITTKGGGTQKPSKFE